MFIQTNNNSSLIGTATLSYWIPQSVHYFGILWCYVFGEWPKIILVLNYYAVSCKKKILTDCHHDGHSGCQQPPPLPEHIGYPVIYPQWWWGFGFSNWSCPQHCIKTKHHHDTQTHVGYHVTKTLSQYHTTASQHDDPNWLTLLPMALWLPSSANNEDEGFPLSTHPISFQSEQCSNQCTTVMPATASYTNCPLPAMHHHTLLAKTTPALTTDTHLTSSSTSTITDVSPDVLTAVEAF